MHAAGSSFNELAIRAPCPPAQGFAQPSSHYAGDLNPNTKLHWRLMGLAHFFKKGPAFESG
jgi:hypothetical protein